MDDFLTALKQFPSKMLVAARRADPAQAIFVIATVGLLIGIGFVWGFGTRHYRVPPYGLVDYTWQSVKLVFRDLPAQLSGVPREFLGPRRIPGDGVTVNDLDDGALILLGGFFEGNNEFRLIQRDGTIVARWPLSYHELFPNPDFLQRRPATDWHVDTHGGLLTSGGDLVFNFEYAGSAQLDRCGAQQWTIRRATHHSLEQASDGGFWIPERRRMTDRHAARFADFDPPFDTDLILHVSADGEVQAEYDLATIIHDSREVALFTSAFGPEAGGGTGIPEIMHINDAEELPASIAADFPGLEAGDLILSDRKRNMIYAMRPSTGRIVWHRIGPWIRQHDPDFAPGGQIYVFDNGHLLNQDGPDGRVSSLIELDFASGETRTVFGGPDDTLHSAIRGQSELRPNGGHLIVEFVAGRVLEVNREGDIVWEYVNGYDESHIAEITTARVYDPSYFTFNDWSCD